MVQIILSVCPLGLCRPQELILWAWLTMEQHSCSERPMAEEPDSTTLETQPGNSAVPRVFSTCLVRLDLLGAFTMDNLLILFCSGLCGKYMLMSGYPQALKSFLWLGV